MSAYDDKPQCLCLCLCMIQFAEIMQNFQLITVPPCKFTYTLPYSR